MEIPAHIFKAYDIRGTTPTSLNTEIAYVLGMAIGSYNLDAGEQQIAVGRDGRLSSPDLQKALIQGLTAVGADVLDIGLSTTPMLYFATHTVCRSGVQITGSHNPKDDNGFKIVIGQKALYGEQIQALAERAKALGSTANDKKHKGNVREVSVIEAYQAKILEDVQLKRPMRVAVDCGNGVAGAYAPGILRALGCEVIELYSEVDGHFPNHHPDPSQPKNLRELIRVVQAQDAELGLAFDGDGDRLGVVSNQGEMIYPDRLLMLFAQDVLKRYPGEPIVFDVKCSQHLPKVIEQAGGKAVMSATGHSLIKAKMREINSPLAGEMSGHIFFGKPWFGFDDGLYTAARLLEILSHHPAASPVLQALPQSIATPELQCPVPGTSAHGIVEALKQNGPFDAIARISHIDGVRADWPDGFGLVRASNTTPTLVLRFEAENKDALTRIQTVFRTELLKVFPAYPF